MPTLSSRRIVRPTGARYYLNVVTYRVVRETPAPDLRILDSPETVVEVLAALDAIPDDAREHFGIVMVNTKLHFVAYHEVSVGTLSSALAHAREIFGPALRTMGVAAIILVHNHPSGDPTPSAEDVRLTRALVSAGQLLDVPVKDHVIIGNGTGHWLSFAGRGLL